MIMSGISRLTNEFIFLTILSRSKVINKFQSNLNLLFSADFIDYLLISIFQKQLGPISWLDSRTINNLLDINGDTFELSMVP